MTELPIQAEDRPAAAVLFNVFTEHYPLLVKTIALITRDPPEAEDIVQEAFLRTYQSWERLRDPSHAPAYVRAVALNLARSRVRSLRSIGQRGASDEQVRRAGPEEEAIVADTHAALLRALRSLPGRQRECLVLRYYDELSDREIGEALGVSPGAVKRHLFRGIRKLQKRMEGLA